MSTLVPVDFTNSMLVHDPDLDEPLSAALWFARRGIHVLPIYPPAEADGSCTCGRPACRNPGKHPIPSRGFHDASTDEGQIRDWWNRYPGANLGLALEPSGLMIMDIDSAECLLAYESLLPPTFTVESQPGHRHYYYRRPEDCPAIRAVKHGQYDLLGDGMIVAPPSVHRSSTRYAVIRDWAWGSVHDLPELPWWAVGELQDAQELQRPAVLVQVPDEDNVDGHEIFQRVSPGLSSRIRLLIEQGHQALDETTNDRSKADMMVCLALVSAGCTDEEIAAVFRAFPIGTEGKYAERGDKYLTLTIANARRRLDASIEPRPSTAAAEPVTLETVYAEPAPDSDISETVSMVPAPTPSIEIQDEAITEHRLAEALVHEHGGQIRFLRDSADWYVWEGGRWTLDHRSTRVRGLAVLTVRGVQRWISESIRDLEKRTKLTNKALGAESASKIRGIVQQAETVPGIAVDYWELDAKPWLLNMPNGTLDLKTMSFLAHDPENLLTQMTASPYVPDASAPRWETFLTTIFLGNEELIRYVQRVVGYSLTGEVAERAFFVLFGHGRNGKSVFMEVLKTVLGSYARPLDPEALLTHRDSRHPADIAQLRGSRLAYAQETAEGRSLNVALIKALTGGDTVTARRMYENPREFKPTAKLFMLTNSKPVVGDQGTAIWDRIKLIPFEYTVPEGQEEKRYDLLKRFAMEEGPGVLNWALEGCRDYLAHGLQEPQVVRGASAEYRSEMDVFGRFLDEACERVPSHWASSASLYEAFTAWCAQSGEDPLPSRKFGQELGKRGFTSMKQGARGWFGLRVK